MCFGLDLISKEWKIREIIVVVGVRSENFPIWDTLRVPIIHPLISKPTQNQFYFYHQVNLGVSYDGKVYTKMSCFPNYSVVNKDTEINTKLDINLEVREITNINNCINYIAKTQAFITQKDHSLSD